MSTNYNKKTFLTEDSFPNDLTVSGTFLESRTEHREWEKDGVKKEMDVMCLILQTPKGIFVARSFNPSYTFGDFKPGDHIVLPIAEYRIDNMLKSITIRV